MKYVYILATISYDSYDIINVFRNRDTAEEHWYHESGADMSYDIPVIEEHEVLD